LTPTCRILDTQDVSDLLSSYICKTAAGLAELHQCGVHYGERVTWEDELAKIYEGKSMQNIGEILSGQHGLAGVQALLMGEPAQEKLRDVVCTLLDPSDRARWLSVACDLQRAKFKPGRKLTAYYDLHLREQNGAGECVRPIAVVWARPGAARTLGQHNDDDSLTQTLESDALQRGLAAPFEKLAASAPVQEVNATCNWEMNIQISPLDPSYPHLVRLSDPRYIREMLAAHSAAASDYVVVSIRYRPGQRHVLRYDPVDATPAPGPGTVYAKLYTAQSRRHFSAMANKVADFLAVCAPEVTALRPQAIIAEDNTILYPWVNGVPLSRHPHSPGRAMTQRLVQTGTMLRALHGAQPIPIQGLPSLDFGAEIKAIARTCEHIEVLLPSVGQAIHRLLQEAQDLYAALPQEAPTFIHGDFKADHVLLASPPHPALTLIDFDSCALADPSFDIGKFLADLDWTYARTNQSGLARVQNDFLTGYNLHPAHPRLRRARIIEALILVKITAHRVALFDSAWAAHTTALIERAGAVLQHIEDDKVTR
jgi:aminoglycoside phosphotransferase (APT) family kinase protein